MSLPPVPPALDQLQNRAFSFYPPILNIEHNEWRFRQATWSEILVVNSKSNEDLWIPRRFLGEISRVEDPVVIVGLTKELEYNAGRVWPHERRVIQMPVAVGERVPPPGPERPGAPAPVVGIRLEPGTESRVGKLIAGVLLVGVIGLIALVMVNREGEPRARLSYTNSDQAFLDLRYTDDYHAVVMKLGVPQQERWKDGSGEIQYQALWYPDRGYYVLLMGTERAQMHYIGTVDRDWHPIHHVSIPSGGDTASLVRNVRRF